MNQLQTIKTSLNLLVFESKNNLQEIFSSKQNIIKNNTKLETPIWQILNPNINLELSILTKGNTNPAIYYEQFYEILLNQYTDYDRIYTDGSKDENSVSSASVPFNPMIPEQSQIISSKATIFTAEANAIDMAINDIEKSDNNCFIIITDSLSCIMALKS